MNHSLEIRNLTKYYGDHAVFRELSLSLASGNVLNVSGPSGSGKTTMLRCIAGLERFNAGEIFMDGDLVQSENHFVKPSKRGIGMVFQELLLWPHLTVYENVNFVSKIRIRDPRHRKFHNQELLEAFKIDDKTKEYPAELSGGELQRVALARALAGDPRILLLDEPFNQMDRTLQLSILEQIEAFAKKKHLSLVLVTHQPATFQHMSVQYFALNQANG